MITYLCSVQSENLWNLEIAVQSRGCVPILRLRTKCTIFRLRKLRMHTESENLHHLCQDWLCNLKIGTQSRDSENAIFFVNFAKRAHDQSSNNFALTMGFYWSYTLTLVDCSYALLFYLFYSLIIKHILIKCIIC